MNSTDDRDLRQRFANLRKAISGVTPTFAGTRTQMVQPQSPSRAIARRLGLAFGMVTIVAVVAFTMARLTNLGGTSDESPLSAQVLAGNWVAPTDFLLDFPGATYLRTVPSIGIPTDSTIRSAPARSPVPRDSRNQS